VSWRTAMRYTRSPSAATHGHRLSRIALHQYCPESLLMNLRKWLGRRPWTSLVPPQDVLHYHSPRPCLEDAPQCSLTHSVVLHAAHLPPIPGGRCGADMVERYAK
jgi:hypothetical protein